MPVYLVPTLIHIGPRSKELWLVKVYNRSVANFASVLAACPVNVWGGITVVNPDVVLPGTAPGDEMSCARRCLVQPHLSLLGTSLQPHMHDQTW